MHPLFYLLSNRMMTVLANVIFPLFLIAYVLPSWLFVLICLLNLIIDAGVILYGLEKFQAELSGGKKVRMVLIAWICGFAADLAGSILLFLLSALVVSFAQKVPENWQRMIYSFSNNVMLNPFGGILSLIVVLLAIALCGWLIYILDKKLAFRKSGLEPSVVHKLALYMAIGTAPYLFLLPTILFVY